MQLRRTPLPAAKAFVDLEADIRAEVERRPQHHPMLVREEQPEDYAPPAVRALKETGLGWMPETEPDPVEVGRLTAATVRQGYENAAKELEAMGEELTANLDKIEASKVDTVATIEELKEASARYREEGKRVALQIENHAALTTEVRATAKALKEKIASAPA